MNEITTIMAQQIGARELKFAKFKLFSDDTKNLITINKGKKYMRIMYKYDTYEVEMFKEKGFELVSVQKHDQIYFDQLRMLIQGFFKFEYVMDRFFPSAAH